MALETSLGVRLFERGARSVRLTEEGVLLFERTNGPKREGQGVHEFLGVRVSSGGVLTVRTTSLPDDVYLARTSSACCICQSFKYL